MSSAQGGSSATWHWECKSPPLEVGESWLQQLRAMRGRAYHDGGRRPAFWSGGAVVPDDDPRDLDGWHILGRCDGELHGSIRLHREIAESTSPVIAHMGQDTFRRFIDQLGVSADSVAEVGRLAVLPGVRGAGLGMRLMAAAWVLAQALGAAHILAIVGARSRHDEFLVSTGTRELREVGRRQSELWRDELRVLHFPLAAPGDGMRPLLELMAEALGDVPAERKASAP